MRSRGTLCDVSRMRAQNIVASSMACIRWSAAAMSAKSPVTASFVDFVFQSERKPGPAP